MKYFSLLVLVSLLFFSCGSTKKLSQVVPPKTTQLITQNDSVSYAMGTQMANLIKQQADGYSSELLSEAILDVVTNEPLLLTEEQIEALLTKEFQKEQESMNEENSASVEENLASGKAFLAKNANEEGVVVTDSGLQYKVLQKGAGDHPAATSTVEVHYVGTLIDGTEFDNSRKRGAPASFPLNRVIPGWTEGVQYMQVGSIYRFFIPPNLAYGDISRGPNLPGGSTLIFDVELISIQ